MPSAAPDEWLRSRAGRGGPSPLAQEGVARATDSGREARVGTVLLLHLNLAKLVWLMKPIPIHQAKTNLSRLIEKACAGEEVVIARGREPVVRLVPIDRPPAERRFGAMRGRVVVDDSFFDPLPSEELKAWES